MEYGFCPSCDKEIAAKCGHCTHRKPNEFYTEVLMKLSNGAKMVIACCTDCAVNNKIFQLDKQALMESVRAAWLKEHSKSPPEVIEKHKQSVQDLSFV